MPPDPVLHLQALGQQQQQPVDGSRQTLSLKAGGLAHGSAEHVEPFAQRRVAKVGEAGQPDGAGDQTIRIEFLSHPNRLLQENTFKIKDMLDHPT